MGFDDQLSADLERVFFADFNDQVSINGSLVVGRLSRIPHEFDAMSGSSYSFEAPSHTLPPVKKNDRLIRLSDGRNFTVRDVVRLNGITRLLL